MDSQVQLDGRLINIVDDSWRLDKLPDEEVFIPTEELPDLEPDNSNTQESLREQEEKWTDLGLNFILENNSA
ncbi:hypothetical protein QYM36_013076 [Artemia franciscana]|uniref:Anaphase-promoting complex subunit 13 n=1 Tax=Artemia franciscana TaxID=6661 RepID=A0AA88L1M3_ARTSF|nr:hypothetical protein QYM36_013076 [Artemia franciscana]